MAVYHSHVHQNCPCFAIDHAGEVPLYDCAPLEVAAIVAVRVYRLAVECFLSLSRLLANTVAYEWQPLPVRAACHRVGLINGKRAISTDGAHSFHCFILASPCQHWHVPIMSKLARCAFRTLDGLIAFSERQNYDLDAHEIIRLIQPTKADMSRIIGTQPGNRKETELKTRAYFRTASYWNGVPLFQEYEQ